MKSLRKSIAGVLSFLLAVSLACFAGGVFLLQSARNAELTDLQERLSHTDQEKLQFMIAGRGLEVLKPAAKAIADATSVKVGDLQDQARNPALTRLADPSLRLPLAKKQEAFKSFASDHNHAAPLLLISPRGVAVGSWPDASLLGKDLKELPQYKLLRNQPEESQSQALIYDYQAGAPGRKAAMLVVCGLDQPRAKGGMLQAELPIDGIVDQGPSGPYKQLSTLSPHALFFILRGSGRELYCDPRKEKAFTEDLAAISPAYRDVLRKIEEQENGSAPVHYDAKDGVLVWSRIFPWEMGQAVDALQVTAAFLPYSDFASQSVPKGIETPALLRGVHPLVWVLMALCFLLPWLMGKGLVSRLLKPLEVSSESVRMLEEGNLEIGFPEDPVQEVSRLHEGFNLLIRRAKSAEEKVTQLNEALAHLEAQNNQDAAQAAKELSEARAKASALELEKKNLAARLQSAEGGQTDQKAQMDGLKAAVNTAQKALEQKNQQNASLSAQVQDQLKVLEDQKNQIKSLQEKGSANPEAEKVRLDATNTLSSELKATITVIKSYISSILGTSGTISSAQQEFLGVVINKSARLERLINDLVDLSQTVSGLKPLMAKRLHVGNLINEIILNAQVQADAKKITLDFASSAANPEVDADPERFSNVVQTLLTQAIKVTSRSEKISVLVSEREGLVEVRITDPGMSLPPDRAAKVFNQFHGVDSQAGPEFIGTGLRFPILKSLVEAHHGKVWIESQVGKGKTFIISLPKAGTYPSLLAGASPAAKPAASPVPVGVPLGAPKPLTPASGLPNIFGPPAAKPTPLPPLGPLPAGSPASAAASATPAAGKEAKPPLAKEDIERFSEIFGAPGGVPAGAPLGKPAAPPVPVAPKSTASLSPDDIANFGAIFGDEKKPAPPVPPAAGPKPLAPLGPPPAPASKGPALKPEEVANFAAIFGDAKPAGAPPVPAAPKPPMPSLAPAIPPLTAKPAPPAPLSGLAPTIAPASAKPLPPPPAPPLPGPAPVLPPLAAPPAPAALPKPAPPAGGMLGSLGDLTKMIQGGAKASPPLTDKGKDDLIE